MTKEEQTHSIIIDTARELFQRYGFERTSVDLIAKTAHKAKGSIYYHFKGKDDIFAAALQEEFDRLKDALALIAANSKLSMLQRLEEYVIRRMEIMNTMSVYRLVLRHNTAENGSYVINLNIKQMCDDFDQWEHRCLTDINTQGINALHIADMCPDITADIVCMILRGLEMRFFVQNKYEEYSTTFHAAMKRLAQGLAALYQGTNE